eukprot:761077-Hanusia_phi.AAC.4
MRNEQRAAEPERLVLPVAFNALPTIGVTGDDVIAPYSMARQRRPQVLRDNLSEKIRAFHADPRVVGHPEVARLAAQRAVLCPLHELGVRRERDAAGDAALVPAQRGEHATHEAEVGFHQKPSRQSTCLTSAQQTREQQGLTPHGGLLALGLELEMLVGQQKLSVVLNELPGRHCHEFASQVVVFSSHAALAGRAICSLGGFASCSCAQVTHESACPCCCGKKPRSHSRSHWSVCSPGFQRQCAWTSGCSQGVQLLPAHLKPGRGPKEQVETPSTHCALRGGERPTRAW